MSRHDIADIWVAFFQELPAWTILRTGFEIMLEAQQRGIMIHAAGIFNTGLLVGGVTYASCPLAPPPLLLALLDLQNLR